MSMLRSSALVGLIAIVGYIVSFGNQLLVAKVFGTSTQLDAYLVAISAPFLLMTLIGGAVSFTLVPTLVQKRHDLDAYRHFSGGLLRCVLFAAITLPILAYFMTPVIIDFMAPNYTKPLRTSAIGMARISWCMCGCAIVSNYSTALHNSANRFVTPVVAQILPHLGMIFTTSLFAQQIGTKALVWGMLLGSILAMLLLLIGLKNETSVKNIPSSAWPDIEVVFKRMPLVIISTLGLSVYPTIDAYWATRLGASNLSYLSYGQRLLGAVGNAVVLGPMTVVLPYLSETIAQGRHSEFRQQTWRALRMLLTVLSATGVICSILAFPLVKVLFERGRFDRTATAEVAALLPGMFVGVLAMITAILLYRAYFAKGDIGGITLLIVAGAALYFFLSGLLSKIAGLQGIIFAYGTTWWAILLCAIARLWWGHWSEILNLSNAKFLLHLSLSLVLCGAFVWVSVVLVVNPALQLDGTWLGFRLLLTAGLGMVSFFSVAGGCFRMDEVMVLFKLLPVHNSKRKRDGTGR